MQKGKNFIDSYHFFSRMIFVFILGVVTLSWAEVKNSDPRNSQIAFLQLSPSENLQWTHLLFETVIAQYLQEGKESNSIYAEADRIFFLYVFEEWQKMIDENKYSSTLEIFDKIFQNRPWITSFKSRWQSLYLPAGSVPESEEIRLGYYRSLVLMEFLKSEKLSPEKRWFSVFQTAAMYLIGQGQDLQIFESMIRPWLKSEIPEFKNLAEKYDRDISLHKIRQIGNSALMVGTPLIGAGRLWLGAGSVGQKIIALLKKQKEGAFLINGLQKISMERFFQQAFIKLNPFSYRYSNLQKAILMATGGNLLALKYFGNWFEKTYPGKSSDENISQNSLKESFRRSLEGHFYVLVQKYPWILDYSGLNLMNAPTKNEKDLVRIQQQKMQSWMISDETMSRSLLEFLSNPERTEDLVSLMISQDKRNGFDERSKSDLMAVTMALARFEQLDLQATELMDHLRDSDGTSLDHLDELRKFLYHNGPLGYYVKKNANLLDLLLGLGGNCVARTVFITSLFLRHSDWIPKDRRLVVLLYSDHMTPALLAKDGSGVDLDSGVKFQKLPTVAFAPGMLWNKILYDIAPQKAIQQRLWIVGTHDSKNQISNLEKGQSMVSAWWSKVMKDRRGSLDQDNDDGIYPTYNLSEPPDKTYVTFKSMVTGAVEQKSELKRAESRVQIIYRPDLSYPDSQYFILLPFTQSSNQKTGEVSYRKGDQYLITQKDLYDYLNSHPDIKESLLDSEQTLALPVYVKGGKYYSIEPKHPVLKLYYLLNFLRTEQRQGNIEKLVGKDISWLGNTLWQTRTKLLFQKTSITGSYNSDHILEKNFDVNIKLNCVEMVDKFNANKDKIRSFHFPVGFPVLSKDLKTCSLDQDVWNLVNLKELKTRIGQLNDQLEKVSKSWIGHSLEILRISKYLNDKVVETHQKSDFWINSKISFDGIVDLMMFRFSVGMGSSTTVFDSLLKKELLNSKLKNRGLEKKVQERTEPSSSLKIQLPVLAKDITRPLRMQIKSGVQKNTSYIVATAPVIQPQISESDKYDQSDIAYVMKQYSFGHYFISEEQWSEILIHMQQNKDVLREEWFQRHWGKPFQYFVAVLESELILMKNSQNPSVVDGVLDSAVLRRELRNAAKKYEKIKSLIPRQKSFIAQDD